MQSRSDPVKQATILALMAAALISVGGAAPAVAQTAQLSPAPLAAPPAPGDVDPQHEVERHWPSQTTLI
jgi:hypothetical protein